MCKKARKFWTLLHTVFKEPYRMETRDFSFGFMDGQLEKKHVTWFLYMTTAARLCMHKGGKIQLYL